MSTAIDGALAESHSGRFIIEQFLEKVGSSSDTDCFSIDDELVFASFNCQHFDMSSPNPYTPAAYTWPSDMAAEAQKELRAELQRLMRALHMGSWIYNVETRVASDGKPYIMEMSPRGGGNRLSEILKMASGQDLIANSIRAALRMPIAPMQDPIYEGSWAEVIVHSNRNGIYQGLQISPTIKPCVMQEDMWVEGGDKVQSFTGANQTIGTLVLKFGDQMTMQSVVADIPSWLSVVVG